MNRDAAENRSAVLQWVIVLGVGALVVAVVLGLKLIPRLNDGQKVLDGAKPAFSSQRIGADVAGIDIISRNVDMADPIVTAEGGGAAEIPAVVAYVANKEHVSQAQALVLIHKSFPHTLALLEALPLSSVSAEPPGLEAFLEKVLKVTPTELTSALKTNFPALTEAITNLPTVTNDWNQIPGSGALTRFDGTPVRSVPQLRDYFKDDLIPAVGAQQTNFQSLDGTSSVNWIAPLLLIVGIVFAAAMIACNLRGTVGRAESIATAAVAPAELPKLTAFLVPAIPAVPRLAQTIVNTPAVTNGWNDVPGMNGATNFAGTPITTVPEVRDYFSNDVIPVLESQRANYDYLVSVSKIGFIGWLVLIVGIIVIVYGLLMVDLAAGWTAGRASRPAQDARTPAPAPSS